MSKTTAAPATTAPAKFIRPGKVVLLLNGRHAGKKAFIVNAFDGQRKSPRPHFLLVKFGQFFTRELGSFSSIL